MNPLKWFVNLWKPETDNSAGVGPFRLGPEYDWMQIVWNIHDYDYGESDPRVTPETPVPETRRSESDWGAFHRLYLIASKEPDPIRRCQMAMQICKIWPIARRGGLYFWG